MHGKNRNYADESYLSVPIRIEISTKKHCYTDSQGILTTTLTIGDALLGFLCSIVGNQFIENRNTKESTVIYVIFFFALLSRDKMCDALYYSIHSIGFLPSSLYFRNDFGISKFYITNQLFPSVNQPRCLMEN